MEWSMEKAVPDKRKKGREEMRRKRERRGNTVRTEVGQRV